MVNPKSWPPPKPKLTPPEGGVNVYLRFYKSVFEKNVIFDFPLVWSVFSVCFTVEIRSFLEKFAQMQRRNKVPGGAKFCKTVSASQRAAFPLTTIPWPLVTFVSRYSEHDSICYFSRFWRKSPSWEAWGSHTTGGYGIVVSRKVTLWDVLPVLQNLASAGTLFRRFICANFSKNDLISTVKHTENILQTSGKSKITFFSKTLL